MSTCGDNKNEYAARQVSNSVVPGSCDPVYGCPPPTEVVCIVAEKVYDECKCIKVSEDEFIFEADPDNPVSKVIFRSAELLDDPHYLVTKPGQVRVSYTYRTNLRLILQDDQRIDLYKDFTVSKNFHIPRAGEKGLHLRCSVPFLEGLTCFIRSEEPDYDFIKTTIICCIGRFILIKLTAVVQLMIPAYGFCPEPADCEEVMEGDCPDFSPSWPPYPPQLK